MGNEYCGNNEVGWGAFDEDVLNCALKEVNRLVQCHLTQVSDRYQAKVITALKKSIRLQADGVYRRLADREQQFSQL